MSGQHASTKTPPEWTRFPDHREILKKSSRFTQAKARPGRGRALCSFADAFQGQPVFLRKFEGGAGFARQPNGHLVGSPSRVFRITFLELSIGLIILVLHLYTVACPPFSCVTSPSRPKDLIISSIMHFIVPFLKVCSWLSGTTFELFYLPT
jgi:hypothetical protein